MSDSTARVMIAGLLGLACDGPSERPGAGDTALAHVERVRAQLFWAQPDHRGVVPVCPDQPSPLAGHTKQCRLDGDEDVDGDGLRDCWRMAWLRESEVRDPAWELTRLEVWKGCRGDAVTLEAQYRGGMTKWTIAPELGSMTWLRWLASRWVAADRVACVGCDATQPGPEWRWVLAAAQRHWSDRRDDTEDAMLRSRGFDGGVTPEWLPLPPPTWAPSALIMVAAPTRWHWHVPECECDVTDIKAAQIAGPKIVMDAGVRPSAKSVTCAGLEIRAEPSGVIAVDEARQRWTWLFRGLPDFGAFDVAGLRCVENTVIAVESGGRGRAAVIDPHTGGWFWEASTDYSTRPGLPRTKDGDFLWKREYGTISFRGLREWLAIPAAKRPRVGTIVEAERPELRDAAAKTALERSNYAGGAFGDEVAATTIDPDARRGLTPRGTCRGRQIFASTTAVLSERGGRAQWMYVVGRWDAARITGVRCAGDRAFVTRWSPVDSLESKDDGRTDERILLLDDELWHRPRE